MSDDYDDFIRLKSKTLCPFAGAAQLDFGPLWDSAKTYSENSRRSHTAFVDHLTRAQDQRMGGFVLKLPCTGSSLSSDISDFRRFVFSLSEFDQSCHEALSKDLAAVNWTFCWNDEPVFLNFFSQRYPPTHSKYIDSPGYFWLFAQPEFVFSQHQVDRSKISLKEQIRSDFANAGMAYDAAEIDARKKGLCFVFPPQLGQAPVRWWDY